MEIPQVSLSERKSKQRTKSNLTKAWDVLDLAHNISKDPSKLRRLLDFKCIWCYYNKNPGHLAVVYRPCSICNVEIWSGNRKIDLLCLECSKTHNLCRLCGADVSLNIERKDYDF